MLPQNETTKPPHGGLLGSDFNYGSFWSGRRGSNPRPRPWQGRALPLSYTRIRIGGDCAPATAELCQMQPPNATASAIPVWPAESAFNPETRLKTPLDRAKPRRSARERLLTSSADCKSGLQAPI